MEVHDDHRVYVELSIWLDHQRYDLQLVLIGNLFLAGAQQEMIC